MPHGGAGIIVVEFALHDVALVELGDIHFVVPVDGIIQGKPIQRSLAKSLKRLVQIADHRIVDHIRIESVAVVFSILQKPVFPKSNDMR